MVRKILAAVLAMCLLAGVCGCKNDDFADEVVLFENGTVVAEEPTASGEETPQEPEEPLPDDFIPVMPLVKTADVVLPDINKLFNIAQSVYFDVLNGTVAVDVALGRFELKNGDSHGNYYRVIDPRFDSIDELESYLHRYFTDECIGTFYDASRFLDHEGHLYVMGGNATVNPAYAGHAFWLIRQTTKRIQFEVSTYSYAYEEDIPAENEPFVGAPEDASRLRTARYDYTIEVDEDGQTWRFSQFTSIF